jgi:ketosteroid isomerase-like protein
MKCSLALVFFPIVVASQPIFAQCSQADRTALETFDKAWGDAAQRGDMAFLEKAYAPGFMSHTPGGMLDRTTTLANTMKNAELNKANPQPVTIPDHYMITCAGNTATISHRNTTPAAQGSSDGPAYSRSVHFLVKNGNSWQVVSNASHQLGDGGQLAYMEQDWNDATRRHDGAWVEKNYAGGATDVSSRNGGIESKLEAIASANSDKRVFDSLELSDMNVRVDGNMAVVTGVNHWVGKDGEGKAANARFRFTDTFVRRDGRWLVWATQGTLIK